MGNLSHLYINKAENIIFEANNSLPFFWIGLLDSTIIERHRPAWKQYDALLKIYDEPKLEALFDTVPFSLDFSISHTEFRKNALRTHLFLQQYFKGSVKLYDDFIRHIEKHFSESDLLYINVVEISNFNTSNDSFLQSLVSEIEAVENNQPEKLKYLFTDDWIASGIGFPIDKKFTEQSTAYRKAATERKKIPGLKRENTAMPLLATIIISTLCPVVSFVLYNGYQKGGVTPLILFLTLVNLLFYVWMFYDIRLRIKKKSNQ